ncbi:MAG: 4Fe-4S binding protein [Acidobacteria bacterium]|nr:4Fe-4S binding protein [Acidobacteriota bacterium]
MTTEAKKPRAWRSLLKSFLLSLPIVLASPVMMGGGPQLPRDRLSLIALLATIVFANATFFLIIHTGKTDHYRAIFFVVMAFCFIIGFMTNLLEKRGSLALTAEDMASGNTPMCHIVIPMTIVPAALTRTIIFPGSILGGFADIASMFVIWIGFTLALGRGFCSWGCFFGGLDDFFSRLRKKRTIRDVDKRWTYLPYAVLLGIILTAAATLSPTYCFWLCPYKAVTEFLAVTSVKIMVQTFIFVLLFIALVIVLPVLTKRRAQCGLFCPFGAFQSLLSKLCAFDIRVRPDRCKEKCRLCTQECPSFAINRESIDRGGTRLSCSLCGKCVDICPHDAVCYHVKGTPVAARPRLARVLYLYPAFLFLSTFGGGMIAGGLHRILLLATTGSMFMR